MTDVKRGIEITSSDLEPVTVRDRPSWRSAHAARPEAGPSEHLLPNYDEYFIGLKDRSAIGERAGSEERAKGGDALVSHLAFIDGQLVGGWRRTLDQRAVTVRLDLITRISRAEKARLAAQAERYAAFVGLPLRLEEKR